MKYYEQLSAGFGIEKTEASDDITSEQAAKNFIDYHVSEIFLYSPTGTLYLAIKLTGEILPAEITALQNYADGTLRQERSWSEGDTSKTIDLDLAVSHIEWGK